MSRFVHLHNHTHFSLQDAACTVETMVKAAVDNGMESIALTDHGVLYGVPEFYQAAVKAGVKPIVGMEAYITAEGSRFVKEQKTGSDGKRLKPYNHVLLLAKNHKGYQNLMKLSTLGFLEGFYYRPRIDFELLTQYSEGIICTSACLAGIIAPHLLNNNYNRAKEVATQYKDLFGDDFYLELQDHGMPEDQAVLEGVPKLSRDLGIKMMATNDIHYIKRDDSIPHNILLLMSDKTGDADYTKLRYNTDQIYFKSEEEMVKLFGKYPGAVENTLEIAEKTDFKMNFDENHFPEFPIPDDFGSDSLDDYFEHLAEEGLKKRYKEITDEVRERFEFEVKTIKDMGFPGYFLITQDFINAAKNQKIPVGPGRGSAAGSLVAYALGITNIEPLEYNLLFERFLNPARNTMPDIDVDFADDQRGEVIDYVRKKYGEDHVAQIITFNTLSSKAVLRDVARVLKIPISTVDKITKHIPSKFGKVYSIDKALDEVPELKWVKQSNDPNIQELIKYGRVLQGMNRNMSKHAAGVVITPGPVSDFVPLAKATADDNEWVTQYKMKELEKGGLLKMDFLGLRTLTIIKNAIELIQENHGIEIDIDAIDIEDQKTFELISRGQTTGIFQFESPPMREYLRKLQPRSLKDLAAMNALYRPGPMDFIDDFIDRRFGRKEVTFEHPVIEPILKETYGIIVYQEQVIQIANKMAGMSLAEADILRRAMGKKDQKAMAEQKVKFLKGAKEKGIPDKAAERVFAVIDKFANYGFNKSHSVAYSYVAYQTAYLKAHYTPEFLAANLTNEFGNKDKVASFLEDCRKLKIPILPPNVNKPSVFFNVEEGKIVFGLSAIKNVGVHAVEDIIRAKDELGRDFESIFDFCANVDMHAANKRVLEGLILAGAFDAIHTNRRQIFLSVPEAIDHGNRFRDYSEHMSNSLFGEMEEEQTLPEPELDATVEDWSEKERLRQEREVTGFYISGHPLGKYQLEYSSFATIKLGQTEGLEDVEQVRAAGVITSLKTKIDKKGKTMAFFTLNGITGNCDCIMFGSAYEEYGRAVKDEEPVLIYGKPESSGDAIKLQINSVIPISETRKLTKFVKMRIPDEKQDEAMLDSIVELLKRHRGSVTPLLEVPQNGNEARLFMLRDFPVQIDDSFISEASGLLGEHALRLIPREG